MEVRAKKRIQTFFERVLGIENINNKLDWIINNMATKADLDAAIAQVKQDAADAAARAGKALGDLLEKVNAGEDFSAEVDALKAAHNELVSIAGDAAGTTSANAAPAPTPAAETAAPTEEAPATTPPAEG